MLKWLRWILGVGLLCVGSKPLYAQGMECTPLELTDSPDVIVPAEITRYPGQLSVVLYHPPLPEAGIYAPQALDSLHMVTYDGAGTIYLSANGGWTWSRVWQIIGIASIWYLSRSLLMGMLYSSRVCFRSTDGGFTWDTTTLPFTPSYPLLLVDSLQALVWLPWPAAGVWVSYDEGRSWHWRPFPEDLQPVEQLESVSLAYHSGTLYCLVRRRGGQALYLLRTRDLGQTWECGQWEGEFARRSVGNEVLSVATPDTLFITGLERDLQGNRVRFTWILRSTDGGRSWHYVLRDTLWESRYYLRQARVHRIFRAAPGVYVGSYLGFFFSTDGGTSWMVDTTLSLDRFKPISPWTAYGAVKSELEGARRINFPSFLSLAPLLSSVAKGEENSDALKNPFRATATVSVYSLLGQQVFRQQCLPDEVIRLPRLARGVYVLKWTSTSRTHVRLLPVLE